MSIRGLLSRYRFSLLLLGIGSIVLLLYNSVLQLDQQTFIYPDAGNYLEASRNLFKSQSLHPYRPILMAFLNGLPYLLGGTDTTVLEWSLWLNTACWLATSLLLFRLLKPIWGEKRSFWVTTLFFLLPGSAVLVYHLLAESIFTLCLIAFVALVQAYKSSGQVRYLMSGLALIVASMLIKPASTFLALATVIWFAPLLWKYRWTTAILPLYAASLLVLLQMVGMRFQYGNFTVSYIDAVTVHNYLSSRAICLSEGTEFSQENNPRAEAMALLPPMLQKQRATRDIKIQLKNNFSNVVSAYIGDVSDNTSHGAYAIKDCKAESRSAGFEGRRDFLYSLSIGQNRLLTPLGFLAAFVVLLRWRRLPFYVVVAAFVVVYTVLLSGVSCGQGDRFMVPLYPFYLLLLATVWKYHRVIRFSVRLRTASRSRT